MFKVCFDFCHFLIRFLFFLLSSDTSFALLLPFNSSFFLNQKHPFFFLIFFFHLTFVVFVCVCLFFLFFFFFFFSHLSLLFSFFFHHFSLICFGFLCSSFIFNEVSNYIQFFNKNIMCNFFLSNKDMKVNLYKLYFLCSHFFSSTKQKSFFISSPKHTCERKLIFSILPLFHPSNQMNPKN